MKISALSFVYNEADKIGASLQSLKGWVDEIIIFDLESTDETFQIAKRFTDQVYSRPHLLCGDSYKESLVNISSGDWVLFWYADEVFSEWAPILKNCILTEDYNTFCFMRKEFLDGIKVPRGDGIEDGTPERPNYQRRLFKKNSGIYFTELVHDEVQGNVRCCSVPPECYISHMKSSKDQKFDNARLYIWYHFLLIKYGNARIEPYRNFMESYRHIIRDFDSRTLSGEAKICLMEAFWWDWRSYLGCPDVTLEEFKDLVGISYAEFKGYGIDSDMSKKIKFSGEVKTRFWKESWEKIK